MGNGIKCQSCKDVGWVCEEHTNLPWPTIEGNDCCIGPGIPCKECNPCDRDNPPRFPNDFKVMLDEDGYQNNVLNFVRTENKG